MSSGLKDKNGEAINEGDHVFARSRGGRHEGDVKNIVTSKEGAEKEDVKHPPKTSMVMMCSTILKPYNMESTKAEFEFQGGGHLVKGEEMLAVDQVK